MRWVAKLNLTVIEAEIENGPQGPVLQTHQQFQFEARVEEPGATPEAALEQVTKRFEHWKALLTIPQVAEKEKI